MLYEGHAPRTFKLTFAASSESNWKHGRWWLLKRAEKGTKPSWLGGQKRLALQGLLLGFENALEAHTLNPQAHIDDGHQPSASDRVAHHV